MCLSADPNKHNSSSLYEIPVKSIFILRPDNLGDAVLFSGTLSHIRTFYDEAEITLCVKKYAHNLFEKCPYIDKIVTWEDLAEPLPKWLPPFWGRGSLETIIWWVFYRRTVLRNYQWDLFLLPVRSPNYRMHLFALAAKAKAKYAILGDLSNQLKWIDKKADHIYTSKLYISDDWEKEHELNINLEFLKILGLGVNSEDIWPEIWTTPEDEEWAKKNVIKINHSLTVAVCPGIISDAAKFYPAHFYAEAFSKLKNVKINAVIFGSKAEIVQCNEVNNFLAKCEQVINVKNLAGLSTVRQLAEGLRACDIVIANETAALHIAVALHKPTIGIIGGGHFGRFYPWGDPAINRAASHTMNCFGCNWQCQYSKIRCIQEIEPQSVAQQFERILRIITSEDDRSENLHE